MKYIFALLMLVLIQNTSYTQTDKTTQDVVINGRQKISKERNEFKQNGQATEMMNNEELKRNNSSMIEQSLGTMAGVQVDKRTMLGGQRILIRGYGNDQKFNSWGVKMYLNGMPLTSADGITYLDDIDFSLVNGIEVIKGPASTMYGGGLGGVARFYMQPDRQKSSMSQSVNMGSFRLLQSQTSLNLCTEQSSTMLNFGHIQSEGYRPHGGANKNFLTFLSTIELNKNNTINLFGSHTYSLDQVSGQISYADYYAGKDPGNRAYISKNAGNQFLTTRFGINHQSKLTKNWQWQNTIFFFNQNQNRIAAGALEYFSSQNFGLRSEAKYKKYLKPDVLYQLQLGSEIQQSSTLISNYRFTGNVDTPLQVAPFSKGSYFKTNNYQNSAFIVQRFNLEKYKVEFIFGLSANQIKYNRIDLLAIPGLLTGYTNKSLIKNFGTTINPHIAIQQSIGLHIINISYSQGFNAPTTATSFINGLNQTNDNLKPERGRMIDLSVQGLLFRTKFDYQFSVFKMLIYNKLTQLNGIIPGSGGIYSFWTNTGIQSNTGLELSMGYIYKTKKDINVLTSIEPFLNFSFYQFQYDSFTTKLDTSIQNYSGNQVVGVPKMKITLGLDFKAKNGLYLRNTFNYNGDVYTDFANTNLVKGFHQLNSKLGWKKEFDKKYSLDVFFAANNLTSQINYTFLFVGNAIGDTDPNNGYPTNMITDVNPGPNKTYYLGGIALKFTY